MALNKYRQESKSRPEIDLTQKNVYRPTTYLNEIMLYMKEGAFDKSFDETDNQILVYCQYWIDEIIDELNKELADSKIDITKETKICELKATAKKLEEILHPDKEEKFYGKYMWWQKKMKNGLDPSITTSHNNSTLHSTSETKIDHKTQNTTDNSDDNISTSNSLNQ